MVPTIEKYTVLLRIETPNPNKVFWKKIKGMGLRQENVPNHGDRCDNHRPNEDYEGKK